MHIRSGSRLRRVRLLVFLFLTQLLTGCQTFSSPLSQWRAAYDGNLVKGPTKEEMADAASYSDSQNLLDRWLTPRPDAGANSRDKSSTMILGSDGWRPVVKPARDPVADAEYQAVEKLFQQGRFAEAEKGFAKIAKSRKGSPWGENSQFYLAESQFQQKKYVNAHDSFELLHKDYPANAYMEELVSREYAIAQIWLAQCDPTTPKEKLLPWYNRFTGTLPVIDTAGSGIKALEHVRMNKSDDPLAERASYEMGNYYMKHHDYESASVYYEEFIHDYTKSPLLEEVQHLAIDARMRAYEGPDYDASGLEKARDLVRRTGDAFPERQANFEGLYHTLDLINDAQAEKTFKQAEYYKRVHKVASAEYYFGKIPRRWPNSVWAEKAKGELAQLAKLPRTPSKPTRIIIPPGASDPFGSSSGMGGMGGMGMGGMGMGGMGMGGMGMGGMGGMGMM
jgi:outer membrane protein assembly factor BamD (BamD/ComL family)